MTNAAPTPIVVGLSGAMLTAGEASFLADARPAGVIVFARNVDTPDRLKALVAEAREAIGDDDALVLIDQEGGRVARLGPPHWREAPPMARFGLLAAHDVALAEEAAWLNARLLAADLAALDISVNCLPVLDLPTIEADPIISDRAFSCDPALAGRLGRATVAGLLAGGVLPVIKHIPGHGRAGVDSHKALPRVTADRATLERTDFAPFRALADAPIAMTAHIVYTAIDGARPATCSPHLIAEVIRGHLGFDNLLLSDDLDMAALSGSIGERARASLEAGCDVVLQCSGDLDQARAAAAACPSITAAALRRLQAAKAARGRADDNDLAQTRARLDMLLGEGQETAR